MNEREILEAIYDLGIQDHVLMVLLENSLETKNKIATENAELRATVRAVNKLNKGNNEAHVSSEQNVA